MINVLSFGAGWQSTALYAMGCLGMIDIEYAIFADTGDEPSWVYEHIERIKKVGNVPIITVRREARSLSDSIKDGIKNNKRSSTIPVFTVGKDKIAAPLLRQCSMDWKIIPIQKYIKYDILGYKFRARMPKTPLVNMMIGISVDEAHRAKDSRLPWITNTFPLLDARMNRNDCRNLVTNNGFPKAMKSSCVYCPWHDDAFWRDLKNNYNDEFLEAVDFDKSIRRLPKINGDCYLHRSLKPLDEVDFDNENQPDLFGNECEGACAL